MLTRTSVIGVAIFTFVGCKGDNGNQSMDFSAGSGDDLSAGGGGGGGGNGMVMGHALILHGPSTVMRSRPFGGARPQLPQAQAGHWALSPNQARVTVVSLTFQGTAAGDVQMATLSNCTPTYVRDQPALTSVLDCPFTIPAGTYAGMGIGVSTTFDVTVNDTVNGFYSDPAAPSKLSTTAPAGGAQSVSITVQGPGGTGNVLTQQTYFSHPITVTASGSVGGDDGGTLPGVTVDITEDLVHTLFADVAGNGTASFALSTPMPPVQMVASIEGAGHVAFYSQTGTAVSALMPGPTDDESSSVRVFYDGTGAASYLFHPTVGPSSAWNANPANSPGAGGMFRAGGYLGVDPTGTLCWAVPQDYTYATYNQLCELQTVSTVGATTTLRCQTMSSVPPPTSGDTYASGCPAITPTMTVPLTLVAN
ncbi:MAG: hypothetical protein JWN44_1967 [Myxococcales bacterium]|nr:hypothetical protein [Myxococcales bacterium]